MYFILYVLIFISFTDLFVQLPITSTYAQSLGATTGLIGFIVGAYSLSNLFSNVFSGHVIDGKGPKNVMLVGFFLNGIILFMYSLVTTSEQLVVVRLLNGVTSGVITPSVFTYLTLHNKGKKGKTFALSGAAVGLAAIIGPAFSGIVSSKINPEMVYRVSSLIMFIGGLLAIFLKPIQKETVNNSQPKQAMPRYLSILKNKGLIFAYIGAISLSASMGILSFMLPLKIQAIDLANHYSGMLMSIFGIVAILFFVLPTNRVFDRFQNEWILPIGLLIVACSQTLASFSPNLSSLIICMIVYGIGFAFIFPSMSALVSKYSSVESRGKAFGLFYGFYSLGAFLGSTLTGILSFSPEEAFLYTSIVLVLITGVIMLFSKKVIQQSIHHS